MITHLKASYVIGFQNGDHCIYTDADVVYENNRVTFVGCGYSGPADETFDFGEAIVSPGFIDLDALADIDHALIDSWQGAETAKGLEWSEDYFITGRRDVFSTDDRDFKRLFAFSHLLRNGITTAMPIAAETHNRWAEDYDEMAATATVAARLGLRVYLGPSYRSGVNVTMSDGTHSILFDEAEGIRGLTEAVRFAKDYSSAFDDLVRGCLLPCRIETLSESLLRETAKAQRSLGCLVRIHALQDHRELQFLQDAAGLSPLELLDRVGLLGPNLIVPHALFLDHHSSLRSTPHGRNELSLLATSGASVVHCPLTSARGGWALESLDRYLDAGINISMGTDSFPPDMIRNLEYASNIAKIVDRKPDAGSAAAVFRAATLGGAKALSRDDLGRLCPGSLADIVVVDISNPRVGVVDDPVRTLVMNCTGADVSDVVVNGNFVVRNSQLVNADEPQLKARAQTYFARMKDAYLERDYLQRDTEALFPPTFPSCKTTATS